MFASKFCRKTLPALSTAHINSFKSGKRSFHVANIAIKTSKVLNPEYLFVNLLIYYQTLFYAVSGTILLTALAYNALSKEAECESEPAVNPSKPVEPEGPWGRDNTSKLIINIFTI